jgi:hypothetical protein
MDSTVFVESLHSKLLLVQKVARNIALMLLLVSLLFPTLNEIINTQAQDTNQINPNTKVTVEKVRKDKTTQIEETTLEELKSDVDLANLNNFKHTEEAKQSQLELTPEKIQEIENQQGVIYENEVAVVNHSVLSNLGYTSAQINVIQNMADFYNSQSIKSLKITFNDLRVSKNKPNLFTVQAQAACQYEHRVNWQIWGAEVWLNNCLIEDIKIGLLTGDTIAIVIGLASGTTLTPLGVLVAAYIHLYVGILDSKNGQCDNRGANLNIPYIGSTLMWVSSVC